MTYDVIVFVYDREYFRTTFPSSNVPHIYAIWITFGCSAKVEMLGLGLCTSSLRAFLLDAKLYHLKCSYEQ